MHPLIRTSVAVLAAVLAVAIGARFDVAVPGSPVPQSLQTLAVVLVGAALGPGRGALALGCYVVVGGLGVPVFADGASGVGSLLGPTGGYLIGFVAGAAVMGWAVRGGVEVQLQGGAHVGGDDAPVREPTPWWHPFAFAVVGAVVAHALILLCGWARLAMLLGPGEAWSAGVGPFLVGGVAKSAAAALLWLVWSRLRSTRG